MRRSRKEGFLQVQYMFHPIESAMELGLRVTHTIAVDNAHNAILVLQWMKPLKIPESSLGTLRMP